VLVLLTRDEDSFAEARRERLKVSGNPSQYDDLGVFIQEQREIQALAGQSLLPLLRVEIAGKRVADIAEEIESYLKQSGRLYASY
jgi:regulator of PEP synthase PpsR (kinase-PPPase family)